MSVPLLAFACVVVPACSASAGNKPWLQPGNGSGRVALRPAYPPPSGKPLYLSGYAGSSYPAGLGGGLYPRTYRQATGYTLGNGFNLFRHHHERHVARPQFQGY